MGGAIVKVFLILLALVGIVVLFIKAPTVLVVLLGVAMYFLPSLVAIERRKQNGAAIFLLNLLLGWTLLGWVVALVWATTRDAQLLTMTV
jgi:hypothetical protein